MPTRVVIPTDLNTEFDMGVSTPNKISVKIDGSTLKKNASGVIAVDASALNIPTIPGSYADESIVTTGLPAPLAGLANQQLVNEAIASQLASLAVTSDEEVVVAGLPAPLAGLANQQLVNEAIASQLASLAVTSDEEVVVAGLPAPFNAVTNQEQFNAQVVTELAGAATNEVFTLIPSTNVGSPIVVNDANGAIQYYWNGTSYVPTKGQIVQHLFKDNSDSGIGLIQNNTSTPIQCQFLTITPKFVGSKIKIITTTFAYSNNTTNGVDDIYFQLKVNSNTVNTSSLGSSTINGANIGTIIMSTIVDSNNLTPILLQVFFNNVSINGGNGNSFVVDGQFLIEEITQ